jgi:hypothetical protein
MFAPISRILLCLVLCMVLSSCSGCSEMFCLGCQSCVKYQDVAVVRLEFNRDNHIDSIVMKANNSNYIIGCKYLEIANMMLIGSKTHYVKFPVNIRLQLFSQGDLWEELSFKMDKNTEARIYNRIDCSDSSNQPTLLTDDYCLYIEKMDNYNYGHGDINCMELNVDGEQNFCDDR